MTNLNDSFSDSQIFGGFESIDRDLNRSERLNISANLLNFPILGDLLLT